MIRKQKTVAHGLRYNAELNNRIDAATKKGGFSSRSAFIRAAIERDWPAGKAASMQRNTDRCQSRSHGTRNSESADRTAGAFAFMDVLAKTFLTCVPEPPRDVHDQAVALGKARYDRFLKSVGMAMVGDSHVAMAELFVRDQEN